MIPDPTAVAASRPSEQEKNSQGEAHSSRAVNHSEDESGNENRQKSVRRRKRTHKGLENVKRKNAKASRSSVSRAGGSHSRRRHVEAVTLFEVITMGRSVVTAEMCQSREDSDVMSKMVEELDEVAGLQYKKFLAFPWILTVTWPMDMDSVEYPLIQSGPYGRWFHSEFCDFVSVLVAQCQHSVIFDSYLMNTLISLLTELSNSYVRAFRHTCTLAAVKLLSSLVSVALSLSVGIENSQKLQAVQKTKTMRQKSTPQLERIQKKITEDRLISMTLDKDNEVAVQTMKLLVLISKMSDDVLSPEDYKQLLQFVYSSQRPLAATAGELLFSRLLNTFAPAADNQDGMNEEEAHKEQTFARLKALLQFYQDSELHKHVVYLVDSLWDCGGALLKDWPTLTSILLQDPCSQSTEQAVLVEILVASVRQASEGPALAGRSGAKKVMSAREKKVQIDDCSKLTEHLLPVLPKLLSKFSDSPDIVASLMKIPQYFLPECPEAENTQDKAVAQRLQLRLLSERSHHYLSHPDHSVRLQAFLGVCDVLTAHSYQLHVWDPSCCGPLLYTPSPKLQRALLTFVCGHVFIGADCDSQSSVSENSEVERLEDLHKRRNLLAAYCKLIVHGVLEMSMAAEIFMYYMKHYNDFGDIIKETMYRTRQIDKIESARTLVLCLQQLFVRLKREQESGGRPQPGVQTFTSIKELARRFALTFGDLVKFRECVVMIHRNGIEFVFQEFSQTPETPTPLYLSYLTILSEFSSKLLKPDKKTVFSYLQKHTAEHIVDLREECWQPLIYYRASLLAAAEGEDAVSYVSSDRKLNPPSRSPFSKQKLEGSKSPCPFSPVESKLSKVQRSSFSLSLQEKTTDTDPFSVPVEPPARRLTTEESVLSTGNEVDDDTVEVEL
eukprot:superscaffoldBa00001199_g9462